MEPSSSRPTLHCCFFFFLLKLLYPAPILPCLSEPSPAVTVLDVSVATVVVPVSVGCTQVPIFADKTSCHIMQVVSNLSSDPATTDAKRILDLIQPNSVHPAGLGAKDWMKLDHNYNMEYLSYNATEFPSFCGKLATFSMWIENWDCGARSTLVARYPAGTGKRVPGWWFYQIDQDPAGTKCCIGQIPASGSVAFWKCSLLPAKLNCMTPMTRRHLALVLNHEDNSIKFYLDGDLAETNLIFGTSCWRRVDCRWYGQRGGPARLCHGDCHWIQCPWTQGARRKTVRWPLAGLAILRRACSGCCRYPQDSNKIGQQPRNRFAHVQATS